MAGIAATESQANAELETLRRERGVRGYELRDPAVASCLDEALKILSDQLYQMPTHFILELIQNADDNAYSPETTATLKITLHERGGRKFLRTDCNEIGFTFKQLDALTKVGQSTKRAITSSQEGYIGEKGIGFKSVFKVANIVHVSSGFYQFKLDRSEPLGMILPILAPFPAEERSLGFDAQTQILLQLHDDVYGDILRDLRSIDPETLIFLRRLQVLDVTTPDMSRRYTLEESAWAEDSRLNRVTICRELGGPSGGQTKDDYIIHRKVFNNLPARPRREGITSSEVILAFPLSDERDKIQKVYTFLPVDDFGFRFLAHADFLLVASREGLEYGSTWNEALRNGIRKTFVSTVERFAAISGHGPGQDRNLRYSWPKYLPRRSGIIQFWNDLHQDILDSLRTRRILESRERGAGLRKPSDLRYVPHEFRFEGATLFELSSIRERHLSFEYDDVTCQLQMIGMKTLSKLELLRELQIWVDVRGTSEVEAQPTDWHRRIASVFSSSYERGIRAGLRNIAIIPLRDGSWVSASTRNLFLPSAGEDAHVPMGVDLSLVDEEAARDMVRRRFYKFLGIEVYSPKQACELILQLHSEGFARGTRPVEDLISDVVYLFRYRSLLGVNGAPDVSFLTTKGEVSARRRRSIYIIGTSVQSSLVKKYRDTSGNPFAVLDNQYESRICEGSPPERKHEFYKWLLDSSTVSFMSHPQLVRAGELTPEWMFLRDIEKVDLLTAVRHRWREYKANETVTRALRALIVPCIDGMPRRLENLAVATREMEQECPHLDFAQLPSPRTGRWTFLSEIGVLVSVSTTARLRELEAIRQLSIDEVDREAIHRHYISLGAAESAHHGKIRTSFQSRGLVYACVPSPKWLPLDACVWTAPAGFHRVIRLGGLYPDCSVLFCNILGVRPASISHVVNELSRLADDRCDNVIRRVTELLSLLRDFLQNGDSLDSSSTSLMRVAKAFPVLLAGSAGAEPTPVLRSAADGDWYIPDQTTLGTAFRGKVNLLGLSVCLIRQLDGLFEALDCQNKSLSAVVKESVEQRGTVIRNEARQNDLRARVKYLACLAADRDASLAAASQTINVWSVSSLAIIRELEDITVEEYDKLVSIRERSDAIDLYVREGIPSDKMSRMNYELAGILSIYLGVASEYGSLVMRLLGEPVECIPGILESCDIFLSDEQPAGARLDPRAASSIHDARSVGEDALGIGSVPLPSANDQGIREDPDAAGSDDEDWANSVPASNSTRHSPSLRERIPTHHVVEDVERRAASYELTSSLVAAVPVQRGSRGAGINAWPPPVASSPPFRSGGNYLESRQVLAPGMQEVLSRNSTLECPATEAADYISSLPLSSPSGIAHRQRNTGLDETIPDSRLREIGFLGESFVYHLFKRYISDWTFENWTSKLRADNRFPPFAGAEKNYLDFTYLDSIGRMSEVLRDAGVPDDPAWSTSTTFHLEVKTTLSDCCEKFCVSQNQLDKMRTCEGDPDNAFVLLRVFHADRENPGIKFFSNPWGLYLERAIDFRSAEGYEVTVTE